MAPRSANCSRGGGEGGFTYLLLLYAIAAMGLALAGAGVVWKAEMQREREAEWLFIGDQYASALTSYHALSPAGAHEYPARLEDLLQDGRFQHKVRHLRRLYPDPFTGRVDWELMRVGGRIAGLSSRSEGEVMRLGSLPFSAVVTAREEAATRHRDVMFMPNVGAGGPAADPGSAAGANPAKPGGPVPGFAPNPLAASPQP